MKERRENIQQSLTAVDHINSRIKKYTENVNKLDNHFQAQSVSPIQKTMYNVDEREHLTNIISALENRRKETRDEMREEMDAHHHLWVIQLIQGECTRNELESTMTSDEE